MAIQLNSFFSSSLLPFSFGEKAPSLLTALQQKVIAIAAFVFASFAVCYTVIRLCQFSASMLFEESDDPEFDFVEKNPLSQEDLNRLNHFETLQKRMGPLPAKYQPTEQELRQLEQVKEEKEILYSPSFAKRFAGIKSVPEFFKVGFADALKKIFDLVEQDRIKLNCSVGTPTSKAGIVVYRFLALDWIKEGKIVKTCQGYELHLNNEGIKLISSLPENVLKLQKVNGIDQIVIAVQFGARCDFIPGEEVLKYTFSPYGINPIAAKCLWERCSLEGREHFLNWILEPAMEENCSEYIAAIHFMETLTKKKRKEFMILRDLIDDMAIALEAKFKHDIAMMEWQPYLKTDDIELQPFVKNESDSIIDTPLGMNEIKNDFFVPWKLDENILSGTTKEGVVQQKEFYQLIKDAQASYQIYFNHLKSSLLLYPMAQGKIISRVSMEQLSHQYYCTHEIMWDHGCLLSNLLSVISIKKKDISSKNVDKLKIAMASYLDIHDHAAKFEGALKNDFKCSVKKFIEWLRKKDDFLDDISLTPTVLEIAAHTLGIRIALFSPSSDASDLAYTKCEADEYGRIVPVKEIEGHYFGPQTKELFFMAVLNDNSYYGLFPRMNVKTMTASTLGLSPKEWQKICQLNQYYSKIDE